MKSILNNTYIKFDITKEWLQLHGFKYNKTLSCDDNEVYTYRFAVYKYTYYIVLECELSIYLDTGEVKVNVFDCNTRSRYAPFYYMEYGKDNKVVEKINKIILKEINRLNIKIINKI